MVSLLLNEVYVQLLLVITNVRVPPLCLYGYLAKAVVVVVQRCDCWVGLSIVSLTGQLIE